MRNRGQNEAKQNLREFNSGKPSPFEGFSPSPSNINSDVLVKTALFTVAVS
jgi:hypothetical protein